MKHTPGPWSIRYLSGIDMEIISEHGKICSFSGLSHSTELMDEHEDEEKGNAFLVAAAPDLLQALEGLTQYFAFMVKDPNFREYTKAIAAINKAKGL